MLKLKAAILLAAALMATTLMAQLQVETEDQNARSERLQYEIDITKDPALGYVPKGRLVNAYQVRKTRVDIINSSRSATALMWTERGPNSDVTGPSNGNTRAGNAKTSGRMRAMWEDLGDATGNTVWVGGIDGGLWKTTNISTQPATWTPINDFFGNLSVSSICQDPANVNVMYFGTGEKAINADAVRGAGVWMSSDHGASWAPMTGTSNMWNVSKMVCDASGNLYVACNSLSNTAGVQRYTKSTGMWTNITPSGLSTRIPEMELSSTGRLHIVCGYYNTSSASAGYRYTDNPAAVTSTSWNSPATTFTTQYNVDLASSGNTLYALPSNSSWQVPTIYKSVDGGANWQPTTTTPSFTSGQSWYNMAVAVDPNNAGNVIVGALDCYKSTNGGVSWTKVSSWYGTTGQYVHADQQSMIWRSNNRVLVSSDGGIFLSADGGSTFSDRNAGLRIKQFYSVAFHPTSVNYLLGGAQDNGVHQLSNAGLSSSIEVTGGDGAFVHIDQDQPQYQWGSYVYNQYRRSTTSGSSWSSVNYSSSTGRFINPTDYDDAGNKMYCSGAANQFVRWEDPQSGATFTPVSLTALNGGTVSAIKVSPYSSNTVFFAGGGSGVVPSIVKATNANSTPSYLSIIGTGMTTTSANISCLELGTSEQNIIAVYSNYGVSNVWVTNNGGASWTAVDGNLPDMPVRWAMFYSGDNTKAVIATETGVWTTSLINGSSTVWEPEANFPNVRTDMMLYRASDGVLAVATHGRGMFTGTFNTGPTCGTVSGLTASAITETSATISWGALSGALNYDVDYKLSTSSIWISAAVGTASLSVALSSLTAGSVYDYRVRANCSGATGAYTQAQFTTASPFVCNAPAGLSSNAITASSATVAWSAVSGATGYDVDYKLSSSSTWVNVATGTTGTSQSITGLLASSVYDWRVKTNCSVTGSGYSSSQFTTSAPFVCDAPAALTSSALTTTSATVNWGAVSGATSYDVDYKLSSSSAWINAATGTSNTSVNITGLVSSSTYDWRVKTNCSGSGSGYSSAQFTTGTTPTCPSPYDVSTNGTTAGAATIPLNTAVYGQINPSGDNDYYKFIITSAGTVTISLTTLPINYDLYLYNNSGTQIANSRRGGTNSESISTSLSAGNYYARVNSRYNQTSSSCYTLRVQTGTATVAEASAAVDVSPEKIAPDEKTSELEVMVFPNPASENLTVYLIGDNTPKILQMFDISGKRVFAQPVTNMFTTLNLEGIAKGAYIVSITQQDGKLLHTEKVVVN